MKKISLLIICVISTISMNAQFSLLNPASQSKEIAVGDFEYMDMYLKNESGTDAVFVWEEESKSIPSGWDYSVCDYQTCYVKGESTGTMTSVADGSEIAFVKPNIMATTGGTATISYKIYEENTPNDFQVASFTFTCNGPTPTVSLNDLKSLSFNVYPNPANDFVIITTSEKNVTITVIDITGKSVLNTESNTNKTKLDLNDLNTGLYIIKVETKNAINTRKIKVIK